MSGTSGSSGFGSVNIEQIDKSTVESHREEVETFQINGPATERGTINVPLEIVSAGDHWSLRMSRQIDPLALMLG
jgi:hypothetical protein